MTSRRTEIFCRTQWSTELLAGAANTLDNPDWPVYLGIQSVWEQNRSPGQVWLAKVKTKRP